MAHSQYALDELPIPEDLVAPEANERGVEIRSYNWAAPHFTKISATDTTVEVPPMHQLNSMIYPRPEYDIPIPPDSGTLPSKPKIAAGMSIPGAGKMRINKWLGALQVVGSWSHCFHSESLRCSFEGKPCHQQAKSN